MSHVPTHVKESRQVSKEVVVADPATLASCHPAGLLTTAFPKLRGPRRLSCGTVADLIVANMHCSACFMLTYSWHVRTQTVQQFTCGIGIAALNILEGTTAVDDQVFRPSAEVYKVQGAEEQRLHNKVSVADSVHGVGTHPAEEA